MGLQSWIIRDRENSREAAPFLYHNQGHTAVRTASRAGTIKQKKCRKAENKKKQTDASAAYKRAKECGFEEGDFIIAATGECDS